MEAQTFNSRAASNELNAWQNMDIHAFGRQPTFAARTSFARRCCMLSIAVELEPLYCRLLERYSAIFACQLIIIDLLLDYRWNLCGKIGSNNV